MLDLSRDVSLRALCPGGGVQAGREPEQQPVVEDSLHSHNLAGMENWLLPAPERPVGDRLFHRPQGVRPGLLDGRREPWIASEELAEARLSRLDARRPRGCRFAGGGKAACFGQHFEKRLSSLFGKVHRSKYRGWYPLWRPQGENLLNVGWLGPEVTGDLQFRPPPCRPKMVEVTSRTYEVGGLRIAAGAFTRNCYYCYFEPRSKIYSLLQLR